MKASWLALAFVLASCQLSRTPATSSPSTLKAEKPTSNDYLALGFDELFERGTTRLEPTQKLLAANGKRVRVVGFMARMEQPPSDGFYLTRHPLVCDEGGGGTGDLPPDAIRVAVVSPKPLTVPFIPGPLEVIGVLQLGNRESPDGTLSHVRILLRGEDGHPAAAPVTPEPKMGGRS